MSNSHPEVPAITDMSLIIGDRQLPILDVLLQQGRNASVSAWILVDRANFEKQRGLVLNVQSEINIKDRIRSIGRIAWIKDQADVLRIHFRGIMSDFDHLRITESYRGFTAEEVMYTLFRSLGWEQEKIQGLPVNTSMRWFDCIFMFRGIVVRTPMRIGNAVIYRLKEAADRHETALMQGEYDRRFRNKVVVRIKILASDWVEARDLTRDRALGIASWVDLINSLPFAITPGGTSLMPWRLRDGHAEIRLDKWFSVFDEEGSKHWMGTPDRRKVQFTVMNTDKLRRIQAMEHLRPSVESQVRFDQAARWLYAAHRSASSTEQVLALWYALEFLVGIEDIPSAFTKTERRAIRRNLNSAGNWNERQVAIIEGIVKNLNAPSFKSRLTSSMARSKVTFTDEEMTSVSIAREFRNRLLHGGQRFEISSEEILRFDGFVRKLAMALFEQSYMAMERDIIPLTGRNYAGEGVKSVRELISGVLGKST